MKTCRVVSVLVIFVNSEWLCTVFVTVLVKLYSSYLGHENLWFDDGLWRHPLTELTEVFGCIT